jgi:predicted metal-dependent peptidase
VSDARESAAILELVRRRVVARYPFHGGLLACWHTQPSEDVSSMAIREEGWRLVVTYSPDFLREHAPQLVGVILHELGHVLFGHTRLDPSQFEDTRALVIAMEVTANEFIHEPLPGSPLLLAQFPFLPPGEGTLERYERLRGRELPSLPDCGRALEHTQDRPSDPGGARLRSLVALARRGVQGADSKLVRSVDKAWSTETEGAVEALSGDSEAEVDWRQVLRAEVASQLERGPSYARPPRRFPHLVGQVPGQAYRPTRRLVMAVVDTSGSVSCDELDVIAAELRRLARSVDVYLVLCDTEIHAHGRFKGDLTHVIGRGGTDLRAVFKSALIEKVRPDLVAYFTDGYGPTGSPPRVPVIWCITQGGVRPAPWGRAVHLGSTPTI